MQMHPHLCSPDAVEGPTTTADSQSVFFCVGVCVYVKCTSSARVRGCVDVVCAGNCCAGKDTGTPLLPSLCPMVQPSLPCLCSPSSLIPPPCLRAPVPADIPLPVPILLLSSFLPPSLSSQPPFPPVTAFCLFTATSNGFGSIGGTQRSLLASRTAVGE